MKEINTKEKYIRHINSKGIKPSKYNSLEEFIFYCNICSIIYYDFLDIELTNYLCEKKWVNFFKNQKLLVSCTQI